MQRLEKKGNPGGRQKLKEEREGKSEAKRE